MSTFLYDSLPVPMFADVGQKISLRSVLNNAYGSAEIKGISGVWLAYSSAEQFKSWNFRYWNPSNPSITKIEKSGVDIGGTFANQIYVPQAEFDKIAIKAGNNIGPNVYVTVELSNGTYQTYQELAVTTLARRFASPSDYDGNVTPAEIVAEVGNFVSAYSGVLNPNDCHFIAAAVAAAAGATFDPNTQSLDPSKNEEGGFWRIVHKGSDAAVANWSTLVKPGDIVRFDWADPSAAQHTILVTGGRNASGQIKVLDNTATGGTIGEHWVSFDSISRASTVTIYRVSPDKLYLVNGSADHDTIRGTVWSDKLQGLAGNDLLRAGAGADVMLGGFGKDTLVGGLGKDVLMGGGHADVFDFNIVADSVAGAGRDSITDFARGYDKLDLRGIDADTDGTAGNQAFLWIGGKAFSGVDGQLRMSAGLLQGDTNGDKAPDFEIKVNLNLAWTSSSATTDIFL
jgi:Ca2+-binding RTX toxin-like protein